MVAGRANTSPVHQALGRLHPGAMVVGGHEIADGIFFCLLLQCDFRRKKKGRKPREHTHKSWTFIYLDVRKNGNEEESWWLTEGSAVLAPEPGGRRVHARSSPHSAESPHPAVAGSFPNAHPSHVSLTRMCPPMEDGWEEAQRTRPLGQTDGPASWVHSPCPEAVHAGGWVTEKPGDEGHGVRQLTSKPSGLRDTGLGSGAVNEKVPNMAQVRVTRRQSGPHTEILACLSPATSSSHVTPFWGETVAPGGPNFL